MSTRTTSHGHRRHTDVAQTATTRLLRYAGVVALLVSAVIHAVLAPSYGAGASGITLGKQFVAQAVLTGAVAIWLLVRESKLAWLVGAVLMAGTAGALLLSHTASGIPAVGPMPAIREQFWDAPQLVTLIAELAFVALAVVRLARWRRR